jgi:hypothetical protein
MYCQYLEYTGAPFTFSDSIYGSSFYLTTGFHGFHVLIGRLYLTVCLFLLPQTSPHQAVSLDLATLYWHFVDIVWVFLLAIVYVWGSAVPTSYIEACPDGVCVLRNVLHERKRYLWAHPQRSFLWFLFCFGKTKTKVAKATFVFRFCWVSQQNLKTKFLKQTLFFGELLEKKNSTKKQNSP